jgi:D-glycero-alpha-D-manno-heptose-7-phosphate kinase
MIIARSPLRITLGGGGTDLPSYYRDHEGFLVSAAIDKYVYVNVMRPFTEGIYLKYSQLEHVEQIAEVKHPIIREALQMLGCDIMQGYYFARPAPAAEVRSWLQQPSMVFPVH